MPKQAMHRTSQHFLSRLWLTRQAIPPATEIYHHSVTVWATPARPVAAVFLFTEKMSISDAVRKIK
jgi:hypothetical protein